MIRKRLDAEQQAVTEMDSRYCNRRTVLYSKTLPWRTVSRGSHGDVIHIDVTFLAPVSGRRVTGNEQIGA